MVDGNLTVHRRSLAKLAIGATALTTALLAARTAGADEVWVGTVDGRAYRSRARVTAPVAVRDGGTIAFAGTAPTCTGLTAIGGASAKHTVADSQTGTCTNPTVSVVDDGTDDDVVLVTNTTEAFAAETIGADGLRLGASDKLASAQSLSCQRDDGYVPAVTTRPSEIAAGSYVCTWPNQPPVSFPLHVEPEACTRSQLSARWSDFPNCGVVDVAAKTATVCVDLAGRFKAPVLEEGYKVVVRLVSPGSGAAGTLDVAYARQKVLRTIRPPPPPPPPGGLLARMPPHPEEVDKYEALLSGAGDLTIKVEVDRATLTLPDESRCKVPKNSHGKTIPVSGRYYLSFGIAPVFAYKKNTDVVAREGDEGINAIVVNRRHAFDVVLNVVAYPWGVLEDDPVCFGFMTGTSLTSPFQSWYLGGQLSSPVAGVGLVGGAALNVVKGLDGDLSEGQPWPDNLEVPTSTQATPGFFAGVNIEDTLFKKVFQALFDESKK